MTSIGPITDMREGKRMAIPMQTGVPAGRILRFLDRLEKENVTMHGFILSIGGRVTAEGYWKPFCADQPHRMFSVSKSITSLAIGILAGRGALSLDDRIVNWFLELLPPRVPEPLARLTISDMLRMATCHCAATYRPGVDENWARTFFAVPPTHEPGTVFAYDTSASQVLAALAEKRTGMPLLSFLEQTLFGPIGATGPKRWLSDPSGVSQGGTGLLMTLRDLDKVAAFCMGDGGGIVPQAYLRDAIAKQTETPMRDNPEERHGYGYQFWRTRNGFSMYGLGGQLAICVPDRQLSLCTTADTQLDPYGVQRIYDAFFDEIVADPGSSPQACDEADPLLARRLSSLAMPPVPSQPGFARDAAGTYRVRTGTMGWKRLRLQPDALFLEDTAGWKELRFGMGAWAHGWFAGSAEPCIASAGWIAPGSLKLLCHVIGDTPCGVEMLLFFRGRTITVQMKRVHDPITAGFEGICSAELE